MNEPFSKKTNLQDSFAGTTGSTTPQYSDNPFTTDLKGEFTSNFGTNTNAVSQLFKDGTYAPSNNRKYIIIGAVVAVLLIIVGVYYYFESTKKDEFSLDEDFPAANVASVQTQAQQPKQEQVNNQAQKGTTSALPGDQTQIQQQVHTETTSALPGDQTQIQQQAQKTEQVNVDRQFKQQRHEQIQTGTNTITLVTPAPDDSITYDETKGPAKFRWEGPAGGYIVFSRNPNFQPETMRIPVKGNSYSFHNPYPGTWYWRVENAQGVSEIRKFTVLPPARRNLVLQEPKAGGEVNGNGGMIIWQGDTKVAFYRVELTNNNSWANPTYRFATSGERVQLQNVMPGTYQLRIGAFSEVSGRWEYTQPISITVR